jgi:signal transduction histidine kinase/DNA-binding NarL/FixJ family response regulator
MQKAIGDGGLHTHEHSAILGAVTRLQELSTRLIQAGDLNLLLSEIMSASAEITKTDMANVQLFDSRTGRLRIVAHLGLSDTFVRYFAETGCPGACDEAMQSKTRVILEDIASCDIHVYPDFHFLLSEGIRALQCTPLICRQGRLVGMLNNHFSYPHRPTDDELRFLDLLARMAADLIDRRQIDEQLRQSHLELEQHVALRTAELDAKNLELQERADQLARLASEITLAEEQERHRLAQVLHDHLQQILVAAKLELSVLSRKVSEKEHQALIEEITGLIEESIRESRSLTVELSPPILHEAGLNAGLQWLARRMQKKYGFEVQLDLSVLNDLERDDISIFCFQSVRELLFNSVKHSGVKTAKVALSCNAQKDLQLTVSDKGRGFDPKRVWQSAARATSGGFGLFSIRERIQLLGGDFDIDSKPGGGAVFKLTVPGSALTGVPAGKLLHFSRQGPGQVRSGRQIRILLVDDHTVMRRGLASMLRHETDIEIVGEAENGQEAIEKAHQLVPDVILMDISMPLMNGLEATRLIHAELPSIGIIGLSMFDEEERAAAMIDAGARAYTAKCQPPEVILAAIRNVSAAALQEKRQKAAIRIVPVEAANQNIRTPKKQPAVIQSSLFDGI